MYKQLHQGGSPIPFAAYDYYIEQTSTKLWDGNQGLLSKRRIQRKTWFFISAANEDYFMGFAIVDAGLVSKAFVYIFDFKTKKMMEDGITVPLGFAADFDPILQSTWILKNYSIKFKNDKISADYLGKKFSLSLELEYNEKGMSFMCPSDESRPFHFTYKNLLLNARAVITLNGKKSEVRNLKSGIDFSKGYPPRKTFWNWVSFVGKTVDGMEVGINLVDKFNGNLENVIWLGEEKIQVGKVLFDYQPPIESTEWEISAVDATLYLKMKPLGKRNENINALIMKSKFTQVFVLTEGYIIHKGEKIHLSGYAVMEEHEALW